MGEGGWEEREEKGGWEGGWDEVLSDRVLCELMVDECVCDDVMCGCEGEFSSSA